MPVVVQTDRIIRQPQQGGLCADGTATAVNGSGASGYEMDLWVTHQHTMPAVLRICRETVSAEHQMVFLYVCAINRFVRLIRQRSFQWWHKLGMDMRVNMEVQQPAVPPLLITSTKHAAMPMVGTMPAHQV